MRSWTDRARFARHRHELLCTHSITTVASGKITLRRSMVSLILGYNSHPAWHPADAKKQTQRKHAKFAEQTAAVCLWPFSESVTDNTEQHQRQQVGHPCDSIHVACCCGKRTDQVGPTVRPMQGTFRNGFDETGPGRDSDRTRSIHVRCRRPGAAAEKLQLTLVPKTDTSFNQNPPNSRVQYSVPTFSSSRNLAYPSPVGVPHGVFSDTAGRKIEAFNSCTTRTPTCTSPRKQGCCTISYMYFISVQGRGHRPEV